MPFLNEDEFDALNETVDRFKNKLIETEEELKRVSTELESKNTSLNHNDEDIIKIKKSKTIQNVILSILTGCALALAYYFYKNTNNTKNSAINIEEIKQLEATRILDSIATTTPINSSPSVDTTTTNEGNTVDENVELLKNNIKDKKIYSVQIGAFTKNRYTLLSETIAGITSSGDLFKYSIGLFKSLKEAQDFRKELVKIGFNDAFVASYINGVRQEIEHPNK